MWGITAGQPSTFDILLTGAIGVLTDQIRQHGGGTVVRTQTGEVFVYNGAAQGLFLRVWHLRNNNPITFSILQNTVSLLKECMFDTGKFGSVTFEIFDGTNSQPCGEGMIVLDPAEVSRSNLIDWTVRGTFTRAQIQLSNNFIASSTLRDLFDHAFTILDEYITHIEDSAPPITQAQDNWYYSLGQSQPMLAVSSLNSNDPQAWQALKEGVQALFEYMQESNHWSYASSSVFSHDFKVGSVAIQAPDSAGSVKRSILRDLTSYGIMSREEDTRLRWTAENTNTNIVVQFVRHIPLNNVRQLLNAALDVISDQIISFHDSERPVVAQDSGEIFRQRGLFGNLLRIVRTNEEHLATWGVLEGAISALLELMNAESLWATAYFWIYDGNTQVAKGTLS